MGILVLAEREHYRRRDHRRSGSDAAGGHRRRADYGSRSGNPARAQSPSPAPRGASLFKHVCAEANRLGLEVNMNNDAGWCGSGGPWITPAIVDAKDGLDGDQPGRPAARSTCRWLSRSASPTTIEDMAVVAFPTPAGNYRIEGIPRQVVAGLAGVFGCSGHFSRSAGRTDDRRRQNRRPDRPFP